MRAGLSTNGGDDALRVQLRLDGRARNKFELEVDFLVPPGITILFGPSGAGKSTTLDLIAGLRRPDRGRITLGGEIWTDTEAGIELPVHQRKLAYVFQSAALFPHLNARENVAYGVDRSLPPPARRQRALELLEQMRVLHLADRKPRTFSGGEAQRVALARTFAAAPKVMLLDEPFSAMDRELRWELGNEVRRYVEQVRIPVLQVTHHRMEARVMGSRVVLLEGGRIGEVGSFLEVLGPIDRELEP